ncbi:MAG: hypothetical protein ACR2RA_08395 [Geminicoccaceae bacterium]
MPSEREEASSAATTSVGRLNQIIKDFGALITTVVGVISGVVLFWKEILALWNQSSLLIRIAVFGVVALLIAFAVYAQIIAPWIEHRRRQRVIGLVETDKPLRPTEFRLRPYEERDHDDFDRPDGAHEKALHWLDESDATCLYLTGFSGTGKSSLLQAWLIPELAAADRPARTVVVRSFADPIGQLVEALKADGAVPIDLPPEETDPLVLLALAADAMAARNGRLLIAIDQFEECLILQDEATKARLGKLFLALQKKPIEGLQLLFVMRTDYLKFDELTALNLPDPRPRENWFNLEALSHADARKILRQTLPGMDQGLEDKVIEEASDVDDLPGLIRPITLNMMGLILKNFAGATLTKTAPGRLIQDFLRQAIKKPGIDQAAPVLLARMITDKGTKKPMAEADLAGATGIQPAMTRKTLYLLGEEGVVRELDRDQNIWEISHDFVARQLGQIIPRLKPSWRQQVQKVATPVALVAWLLILGGGYPIYQVWDSARIADELRAMRVGVEGEKGAYEVEIHEETNVAAIDQIFAHLKKLDPTSLLIIDVDQLQALPALDNLTALTSLAIVDNAELQELPSLDRLTALTRLWIVGNAQLQSLEGLSGLTALTSLAITDNAKLGALEELNGLTALTSLAITDNAELGVLEGLNGLTALTRLEIWNNHQLQALPLLDSLTALTRLEIWNNDQLQALPTLDRLTALTRLWIVGNAELRALEGLDKLTTLTSLWIRDNHELQALPSLDRLTALTSVEIWNNDKLQELPSLAASMNLNTIRISGNNKIDGLPKLGEVDHLKVVAFHADDIEATVEATKGLPRTVTIETAHDDIDEFSNQLNDARAALGLPPVKVVRWRLTPTR